jgi:hypothetical protein
MATGRVPTTANSPLTAKGDLFGYSTTQARVAVGNNGETLVADSSTATGLRYTGLFGANKNQILNGDFRINQRGFSSTTSDATYGFDRWFLGKSGDGTVTYSAQTFTPGTAPVSGYEGVNFARVVTTGQTTTSSYALLAQRVEDVRTLAGQTATVSFWAKAASGIPSITVELQQNYGTGGTATSDLYKSKIAITTSWVRYSVTIALSSISGKTIGTGSNLGVALWVSAGSNFNSRLDTLGLQANTFDIWGVQVEAGSVATAFQTATGTLQGELAACQRYYERINATSIYAGFGSGFCNNTTTGQIFVNYQTTKRTQPSGAVSAAGDFLVTITGDNKTASGVSFDQFANNGVYMAFTVTGLTAGQGCVVRSNNKTTSYIELSSEL